MGASAHEAAVVRFIDLIVTELDRAGIKNKVLALDFFDTKITAAFEAKGVRAGDGYPVSNAACQRSAG